MILKGRESGVIEVVPRSYKVAFKVSFRTASITKFGFCPDLS
jgi:hypothetical protein